ncbi:MAG: hypothetical protein NTZ49_00920 [Candidatus Parcubacteria bacterium]|nr:hypothetical protein [Candidatus Parcubacteria bacterium]
MNHKELMGRDLSGWKLKTAYHLELHHNLWGFFPAIITDKVEQMFICLDKKLLLEVAKFLPPRRFRCCAFKVLANEKLGIAFDLRLICEHNLPEDLLEDTSLFILNENNFQELLANSPDNISPFQWAPGLIGDEMNADEFRQSLILSLKHKA